MHPRTARALIAPALVMFALLTATSSSAHARNQGRTISTAGVSLQIPAGWHAHVASMPACDPARLIVASSTLTRIGPNGRLPSPHAGTVLVLLLEDRYRQDRPIGDLHRPQHFSVTWDRLAHIEPCCGLPASPAHMRYFKTHGRYLGFIVYPGKAASVATRTATLSLMDSLHVNRS
ncbi:MAG: hypothetical protein ACRDLM_10785 [Gaiellaceae bacterium]